MTAGADGITLDGMNMARIEATIASIKDRSYQPKPARRTYIMKKNGKKRPLGIPSANDRLVEEVVRSLRAAFFIAIEDDCIRKNPFSFALNKVLEDDRGEKTVLTPEQEVSLIDFAQNDPVYQKYADELIILLGTGLRISEFCGLTTSLDFRNRLIRVDHQLLRDSENGYYIETPKTKNGCRAFCRIYIVGGCHFE